MLALHEINSGSVLAISRAETQAAIRLLMALPHGVSSMSAEISGFVETSNNIGVMELKGRRAIHYFQSSQLGLFEFGRNYQAS